MVSKRRVSRRMQGGLNPLLIHTALQNIKPISAINNALQSVGLRDSVRNRLNKSAIGKLLVKGADLAQKNLGYGRKRRRISRPLRRVALSGGSKTRKRVVRRPRPNNATRIYY